MLKTKDKMIGYKAKSFKVLDTLGNEIKNNLPGQYITQMDEFIQTNSNPE